MIMKLELSIHASQLQNVAGAFKGTSDPFAVVTQLSTKPGDKPVVLGKTEVIKNSLSPNWVKVFQLDYALGTPCSIAVNIFDEVRKGDNIGMGSAIFDVAEILGARGNTKAKKMKKGGIVFAALRKSEGSGILKLKCKGSKLKNVEGFFGTSDPFFEIARKVDSAGGQTWDNVYRSKEIHNTLNPEWEEATLELSILCGGDLNCPLEFTVFDYESSGKHVLMGRLETSVNALVNAAKSKSILFLTNKGKSSGTLIIDRAEVSGIQQITDGVQNMSVSDSPAPAPAHSPAFLPSAAPPVSRATFVDYVSGGCELNVVVAIDFTGSNGDPRKPGTLHYIDPNSRNEYEKAIAAIVSILLKYDSDQKIPVLGFGAKYDGVVRHVFQCGPTPEAQGLQGVLDAYNATFRSGLILSKPTVFTEVMEAAAAHATNTLNTATAKGSQAYTILLIVTDGAVSDVNATAACLSKITDSPLSIVIVGVGNADFTAMQFLDDVNAGGGGGKRDIAQFVPFNQHAHYSQSLTQATLEEIPRQLESYFKSHNIAPHPAVQRTDSEIAVDEEEDEIDLSLCFDDEQEIVIMSGGDDFVDGFNAKK